MNNTITTTNRTNNLIQVRVPAGLKERTSKLFESLGTSTSDVIRMMLIKADETKSIPFQVRTGAYPITANERIEEIKATFALEGMPLSEQNIQDLIDIELAKTTTEEVRQRILKEIKEEQEKA
ncbi:MAG: type II toxin-antitoxin system RelB/DinJ family antitoxin [Candidatus Saccharibacteria bacterium]|nr:type II toxin-antitoxin system RelB/DinJ family antitoxin [Candidatus Saccharibacteria bacterium]